MSFLNLAFDGSENKVCGYPLSACCWLSSKISMNLYIIYKIRKLMCTVIIIALCNYTRRHKL